jgi:amino acid transporter
MAAYLLATWAVMVTIPATDGQSAQVTALATAVGAELGSWVGKLVAILLAALFLFITVVYNFSFARLVYVSGLDQKLPAAMAKVNKHKVPSNAVWAQTVIASLFALVAFIVFPSLGIGGGQPIDIQTKVYDVLQAAVTVIWCISMVVLFGDHPWTPLISNDSGSLSIGGATIAYGAWFYLVAGIAVLSLLVAGGIYFLGNATSARAVRTTQTT